MAHQINPKLLATPATENPPKPIVREVHFANDDVPRYREKLRRFEEESAKVVITITQGLIMNDRLAIERLFDLADEAAKNRPQPFQLACPNCGLKTYIQESDPVCLVTPGHTTRCGKCGALYRVAVRVVHEVYFSAALLSVPCAVPPEPLPEARNDK